MQLKKIVEPFGEVNVYPSAGGGTRVVATILMEPHKEGAQTGIALDGSGSMAKLYGVDDGSRVLSPIFGGPKKLHNEITPIAQKTLRLSGAQDRRRRRHDLHLLGCRRERQPDRSGRRPAPTRPSDTSSVRRTSSAPARNCCPPSNTSSIVSRMRRGAFSCSSPTASCTTLTR